MSVVLFVTAGAVVIYMQNGIAARLGTSSGLIFPMKENRERMLKRRI